VFAFNHSPASTLEAIQRHAKISGDCTLTPGKDLVREIELRLNVIELMLFNRELRHFVMSRECVRKTFRISLFHENYCSGGGRG